MRLVFFIPKKAGIIIKAFLVGTVHTYNGERYQKQSDGAWTHVGKGAEKRTPAEKKKALAQGHKEAKKKYKQAEERKAYVPVPEGLSKKWKLKKWNKRLGEIIDIKTEKKPLGWKVNNLNEKKLGRLQKDTKLRNRFIMENKEFLFDIVHKVHKFYGEKSDPVQDAYEGFILSINRAEPKRVKEFQQYAHEYIKGYALNRVKEDAKTSAVEESLNVPVNTGGEGGDKVIEKEDTIPSNTNEIGDVEFRSTVSQMAKKIKSDDAKKVFAYLVMGHTKAQISRIMKHKKAWATKVVDKYIKPLAKKYLMKSGLQFALLMKRILED